MSLFRIHSPNLAYPENASCPLSAFPTFRISYLCVLMLVESGSLKIP